MATMQRKVVKMEKLVMVDVPVYSLEIDQDEFDALQAVLARVGGNPEHTSRKHIASIYERMRSYQDHALENPFGVDGSKHHKIDGCITFEDSI